MLNTKEQILSAGPSITEKECSYVYDAVKNGWYSNYADYILKFEKEFAKYVNAKYSIAVSSGTAALHLSLIALNIKAGDEVIVPEVTWVACGNVVKSVGAEPVFVDIEEGSWTIKPDAIQKAITAKTKAIMPVHSYGHPSDMDRINQIAKEHNLYVIEDAAPSIGSEYFGRRTGALSDIGCFSFQGAKILVTGEGGMLVTNSEEYYKRALSFSKHGRDDSVKMFWSKEVGTKYSMANILAALGLAQLERIHELIENKRRIHDQYELRFKGIEGIDIFKEKDGYFSNCSYPSILLNRNVRVSREILIAELGKRNINVRSVFPCLSSFPSFEKRFNNDTAKYVSENALNLPCAHNIKEEDIDFVVHNILEILSP